MEYLSYLIIVIFLIITILSYFRIADHFNIIDKPNERSSHKKVTLRGGGIIFYFGVLAASLLFGIVYPYFLIGLTLIAIISFIDDIKEVRLWLRLSIHFISMLLMFYDCGLFSLPWLYLIVSLILATGIINAYNFMDGINGITGGYSLAVLGAMLYINNYITDFISNDLLLSVILSVIVFNFFNFRKKAKCFAGDVGSVSIAFIIVFMLTRLIVKTNDLSYIILLVVYGVDSVCTIIHRLMLKENIFKAHRKHLYQIMSNELKIPHVVVSLFYMTLQGMISLSYIYIISTYGFQYNILLLFITILILTLLYIILVRKYFHLHIIKRNF